MDYLVVITKFVNTLCTKLNCSASVRMYVLIILTARSCQTVVRAAGETCNLLVRK